MTRRAAGLPLCCLLLLGAIGCRGGGAPIPAPDLSAAEEPVRVAVEQARRAVEAAPDSAQAWGDLGDRLRVEGWRVEAAACYGEAERLEPDRFLWPYRLGMSLRAEDPARAERALARASALDDRYAPAQLHRALTLVTLGRFEEARACFERAHLLDPQMAPALLGLGQLALSAGRTEEAEGYLSRSLELDPSDGRTHLALAQLAQIGGDRERAARHAAAARRLLRNIRVEDPRDRPAAESAALAQLTRNGRRLLTEGRPADALPFLQEAIRRDPQDDMARLTLGLALVMLGRPDEAEPQLRQAVSLEPLRPESHAALGKFLLHARDLPAAALVELAAAVRLDPDDLATRLHLGLAQSRTGALEHAESTFREILSRAPSSYAAALELGRVLARAGKPAEARSAFERALRLRPGSPEATRALAALPGG